MKPMQIKRRMHNLRKRNLTDVNKKNCCKTSYVHDHCIDLLTNKSGKLFYLKNKDNVSSYFIV